MAKYLVAKNGKIKIIIGVLIDEIQTGKCGLNGDSLETNPSLRARRCERSNLTHEGIASINAGYEAGAVDFAMRREGIGNQKWEAETNPSLRARRCERNNLTYEEIASINASHEGGAVDFAMTRDANKHPSSDSWNQRYVEDVAVAGSDGHVLLMVLVSHRISFQYAHNGFIRLEVVALQVIMAVVVGENDVPIKK